MPVTKSMVEELTNSLLKELEEYDIEVNLQRNNEAGTEDNRLAEEMTKELRKSLYTESTAHEIFPKFKLLCEQLSATNLLRDDSLGEHAWILKYIPIFNSDVLTNLIEKLTTEYGYTEQNEILLLSVAAIFLAYNSSPILFIDSKEQFVDLTNTWLEALLTYNYKDMPSLKHQIENWSDRHYYASDKNVTLIQVCSEKYHRIAVALTERIKLAKWESRANSFNQILAVLPKVLDDNGNFISGFHSAINRLQYINDNQLEFQVVPVQTEDNHCEAEVGQLDISSEKQQNMMSSGVNLMIKGISDLLKSTNPQEEQQQADQKEGIPLCAIQ
jgi:hypothetical protein